MTPEEIAALLQQPDKQQALLAALRGKQSLGYTGQLTGDRVLAPFGAGLQREAVRGLEDAEARPGAMLGRALEAARLQDTQRRTDIYDRATQAKPEPDPEVAGLKVEKMKLDNERLRKSLAPKAPKGPSSKSLEGLPAEWELLPDSTSSKIQREKFAGVVQSSKKMQGLTSQMRDMLKGAGASRILPGSAKTRIGQLATQLQIEAKNVAELGALSGPDMALMNAIAADPTKVDSFVKDIPALLDGLDAWGNNSVKAGEETIGARRRGGSAAAKTDGAETKTVGGRTFKKTPQGWVEAK